MLESFWWFSLSAVATVIAVVMWKNRRGYLLDMSLALQDFGERSHLGFVRKAGTILRYIVLRK
ncbi:MAG: hypothetical protein PQJ59_16970 [Spirochaetales bacterium]|nr:hypothetical protein [Spirochaetales bacterium]